METIQKLQENIIEELNGIGDPFDQYSYLIELAGELPGLSEDEKTDEILVKGCQSRVWLLSSCRDGVFYMRSDSDTLIVRGVLRLMEELLNGQPAEDVAAAEITFLNETIIMETFEESRQKGMGYIIAQIRLFAGESCK